jgi:hypothetical protein
MMCVQLLVVMVAHCYTGKYTHCLLQLLRLHAFRYSIHAVAGVLLYCCTTSSIAAFEIAMRCTVAVHDRRQVLISAVDISALAAVSSTYC